MKIYPSCVLEIHKENMYHNLLNISPSPFLRSHFIFFPMGRNIWRLWNMYTGSTSWIPQLAALHMHTVTYDFKLPHYTVDIKHSVATLSSEKTSSTILRRTDRKLRHAHTIFLFQYLSFQIKISFPQSSKKYAIHYVHMLRSGWPWDEPTTASTPILPAIKIHDILLMMINITIPPKRVTPKCGNEVRKVSSPPWLLNEDTYDCTSTENPNAISLGVGRAYHS